MNFPVHSILIWCGAFFASIVLALAEIKQFTAWSQVIYLWNLDADLVELIKEPHYPRFLIVYPGLLLREKLSDFGFSLYISIFFAFNCVLWRDFTKKYSGSNPLLFSWIIFLVAHASMNGRGVIAWNAWLICMHLCFDMSDVKSKFTILFRISIACFLATVSTGVFVVVVVSIFLFLFKTFNENRLNLNVKNLLLNFLLFSPLFILIIGYFVVSVNVNVNFYGGGFDGVLGVFRHGMGKIFYLLGEKVAVVAIMLFIIFLPLFVFLNKKLIFQKINILQITPIVGGVFGFTVLTLAIPVFLSRLCKIRIE